VRRDQNRGANVTNEDRARAYARQNNQTEEFRPTGAQRRRLRKAAQKEKGS
jgi:hypothetical protein